MKLDIATIAARADKATAGPWAWNSRHGLGAPNRLVMWPSHEYGCDLDIEGEEADLDFIAHARTDIPDLIAALEAAERERDTLKAELDWYGEQARLARLIHSEGDKGRHALQDDGGKKARVALEAVRKAGVM